MRLKGFAEEKLLDRIRQFGVLAAAKQLLFVLLRPLLRINTDIILVAPNPKPVSTNLFADVRFLTLEIVRKKADQWQLTSEQVRRLEIPRQKNCQGFFIELDGRLAGYAFIQNSGMYRFGVKGCFEVSEKFAVFKNQFVFREFRGRGLTFQLNAARMAALQKKRIPLGFVMPENRYSIRSLKKFGFIEILQCKVIIFLGRFCWHTVKEISSYDHNKDIVELLMK